jgi:hypothetical protein
VTSRPTVVRLGDATILAAEPWLGDSDGTSDDPGPAVDDGMVLAVLEERIEAGLATFLEVGAAMIDVLDRELYRDQYPSFATYLKARWGVERRHGARVVEMAGIIGEVG